MRRVVGSVTARLREACRPALTVGFARDFFRTREQLMVENAMLRQQLIVASRTVKRPAFRPLFAFFIVDVNTKEVIHVGATRAPNESWTAQQMRDATPFEYGPQFIIRDHDNKFGASFDRVAEGAGVCVVKTAIRAPLMNAVCERFVGSVRRECLDHIIILGETHLRAVLDEYVSYFNRSRPHQGLEQRIPLSSTTRDDPTTPKIVQRSVLGGLHHDYRSAA